MNDIFPHTTAFMAAEQASGNANVDLLAVAKCVRKDGQKCGWQELPGDGEDAPERGIARMMLANFLAGMFDEPLENSPRYTTAQIEFPDMDISIAASRPGGTTPLKEHESIRHLCARAGWNPDDMSLSEFVGTLIHASKKRG